MYRRKQRGRFLANRKWPRRQRAKVRVGKKAELKYEIFRNFIISMNGNNTCHGCELILTKSTRIYKKRDGGAWEEED